MASLKSSRLPKTIDINSSLENVVITPLTCAAFVMEFIKNLLYQKVQLPYPFSWLKLKVNRKRASDNLKNNLTVDRHYKVASTAFDFLENLSRQLHREFKNEIDEVHIIFGATIIAPSEIYLLKMPVTSPEHVESNHLADINKTVGKIMRNIMLTTEWYNVTELTLPPTNMHVLLKKKTSSEWANDFFLPKDAYRIPPNCNRIKINLENQNNMTHSCCSNLEIFQDSTNRPSVDHIVLANSIELDTNVSRNNLENNAFFQWYQAKSAFKGFKDAFINNQSVSDLW